MKTDPKLRVQIICTNKMPKKGLKIAEFVFKSVKILKKRKKFIKNLTIDLFASIMFIAVL